MKCYPSFYHFPNINYSTELKCVHCTTHAQHFPCRYIQYKHIIIILKRGVKGITQKATGQSKQLHRPLAEKCCYDSSERQFTVLILLN